MSAFACCRTLRLTCLLLLACMAVFPLSTQAEEGGVLECWLEYRLEGWSLFYKTAEGQGTVRCNDGSRLKVAIVSRGGGITFGKSRIHEGRGEFYGIYRIRDVLGRYAAAEVHAGAVRSARAQVVTKGTISLALTGRGTGWDLGVSIGSFVLQER